MMRTMMYDMRSDVSSAVDIIGMGHKTSRSKDCKLLPFTKYYPLRSINTGKNGRMIIWAISAQLKHRWRRNMQTTARIGCSGELHAGIPESGKQRQDEQDLQDKFCPGD